MVAFSLEVELWRWGGINNFITTHFYHTLFSITCYLSCKIVLGLVANCVVLELFGRNLSV